MSLLSFIVLTTGFIFLALAIAINYRRKQDDLPQNYPLWGLGIIGVFFLAMNNVFTGILAGIINGFLETPQHIDVPNLEITFSPVWIGSLVLGIVVGLIVYFNIRRRAHQSGMSYDEFLLSKMPQDEATDQKSTQTTSSDQSPTRQE